MFDLAALARLDAGLAQLAGREMPAQAEYVLAAVSSSPAPLLRTAEPSRCPFAQERTQDIAHGAAA